MTDETPPPAGPAEPVAWRLPNGNLVHHTPGCIWEAGSIPLYAAPVAGEAAAILRGLPPYLRHSIGCDGPSGRACICDYDKMEARIRAALAPGGRPRCSTCGGDGELMIEDDKAYKKGLPSPRWEPCPDCPAPAEPVVCADCGAIKQSVCINCHPSALAALGTAECEHLDRVAPCWVCVRCGAHGETGVIQEAPAPRTEER